MFGGLYRCCQHHPYSQHLLEQLLEGGGIERSGGEIDLGAALPSGVLVINWLVVVVVS